MTRTTTTRNNKLLRVHHNFVRLFPDHRAAAALLMREVLLCRIPEEIALAELIIQSDRLAQRN